MTHGVPVQAGQQTRFREVWFQWNVLETHIIYIYAWHHCCWFIIMFIIVYLHG